MQDSRHRARLVAALTSLPTPFPITGPRRYLPTMVPWAPTGRLLLLLLSLIVDVQQPTPSNPRTPLLSTIRCPGLSVRTLRSPSPRLPMKISGTHASRQPTPVPLYPLSRSGGDLTAQGGWKGRWGCLSAWAGKKKRTWIFFFGLLLPVVRLCPPKTSPSAPGNQFFVL